MQHIAVACDRIQTQRAAHISTQSTQQGPAQQTAKAAVLAATAERPVAAAAAAAADAATTVMANAGSLVGHKSST